MALDKNMYRRRRTCVMNIRTKSDTAVDTIVSTAVSLIYREKPNNQAIHKNKRCIRGGVFHPSCNAFLIVFIAPPRDLTQHSCRTIVKQPHFVKRLKYDHSLV